MNALYKNGFLGQDFVNDLEEEWVLSQIGENRYFSEIVEETRLLKHKDMGKNTLATDECGIEWDGDNICNLSDFVDTFSRIFLGKICNMAESMIGEEIGCYFEDEE
jgi:hypothetical protein